MSLSGILLDENSIPEQLYGHSIIQLSSADGYFLDHAEIFVDSTYITLHQSYRSYSGTVQIQTIIFFDSMGNFLLSTEINSPSLPIESYSMMEDHGTWSVHIPFDNGYDLIWGTSEQEVKYIWEILKGINQ